MALQNRKRIKSVILYYLLTFLTYYIARHFMLQLTQVFVSLYVLLIHLFILIGMLLITYVTSKSSYLSYEKYSSSIIGVKKDGLGKSFLWANAFLTPIPLLWLVGTQVVGTDIMLIAAKPSWANLPISFWTFAFAILFWSSGGIIFFCFWQAFPYEALQSFPKKYVIPLIAILWAGLYNAPLLTGKLDPGDVIFLGFLFTVVYHKSRNSIGSLLAYLLNENPLWWIIAATFGTAMSTAFIIFLIVRILISSISTAILVISSRK